MDEDLESSLVMPPQMINPSENFTDAVEWLTQVAEKLGTSEEANEIKQIANSIRVFKLWQDVYVGILQVEHAKAIQDLKAELEASRPEDQMQVVPTPPETTIKDTMEEEGKSRKSPETPTE